MSAHGLELEQNLALFAGAGSGKTHGLITICLHLLGGARGEGTPLPPSRLWLVTFTEKAAGEMRERLRQRVEALIAGGDAQEPELRESFGRLGRPFPDRGFWRGVLDGLSAATVTTFHSACAQMLRRAPAGAGVAPDFALLDDRDAGNLVRDCAERVVLYALAEGMAGVEALCRDLEFGTEGSQGLTGALVKTYGMVREEGLSPERLRVTNPEDARRDFEEAVLALKSAVLEAMQLDLAAKKRFLPFLSRCAEILETLRFETFWSEGGFPALQRAAEDTKLNGAKGDHGAALKEVKYRITGKDDRLPLSEYHAGVAAAAHEKTFLGLMERLAQRHGAELRQRNALDFSGLLLDTRDLLLADVHFRREIQARIGALLVDEFQDTNRLQLDLVTLLAEKREGGPRPAKAEGVEALPLEPALLCAVGDRKQSIYEFRGADVSVFETLARKIVEQGGGRAALKRSWRSVPPLVEGVNTLFSQVMGPTASPRDYEVIFDPGVDALEPVRPAVADSTGIEVLAQVPQKDAESCRVEEAEAIAARLAELLSSSAPWVGEKDGSLRPPRGGDIAILFRSFTSLEVYRQALMRHGLPHRIVRGRGFYGAQEVLDVASLLSLISDPSDGLCLAAVLRSPFVALSDSAIVLLGTGARGFSMGSIAASPDRAALAPDEQERLTRFLDAFAMLRLDHDRVGLRQLLLLAFAQLPYREAVAAAPFGEQALANLDKLLALAQAWDRRAPGDLDGFARELIALASAEPREAQADAFDVEDPRAIQLLTVHQSKGLEWPVVVVPNLAGKSPPWTWPWFFDRTLGFAMKVRGPDGAQSYTPRTRALAAERTRREAAESRRVLYVALTRARDRLILSGRSSRESNTWRALIDPWIPEAEARGFLQIWEPGPVRRPSEPPVAEPGGMDALEAALKRVRSRAPPPVEELVLPVTQLELFAGCPRRYWLQQELGLNEPSAFPQHRGQRGSEDRAKAQLRGSLAHRLLECVALDLPPAGRREALIQIAQREVTAPVGQTQAEVVGWVERFLSSDWGRRLSAAPERVHRELPFLLRIPCGSVSLCIKGQIDLLLEEDDGVTVLDYKTSADASHAGDHALQLACYALAARAWAPPGGMVRTGLVYLRSEEPVQVTVQADLGALEAQVAGYGRSLVEAVRAQSWGGQPEEMCRALRCGHLRRCHPSSAAL